MQYIKIQFTFGLDCEAYQEIEFGMLVCIKDVDGNIIDTSEIVTESFVVDDNPVWQEWMILDPIVVVDETPVTEEPQV